MGLTKKRMKECDALFFYQLLMPIVNGAESGIPSDCRLGFYKTVAKMTNIYAIVSKDRGGTRRHKFMVCVRLGRYGPNTRPMTALVTSREALYPLYQAILAVSCWRIHSSIKTGRIGVHLFGADDFAINLNVAY